MFKTAFLSYRWIPSLYFMQGLSFAFLAYVMPVFYKNLHFTNPQITFITSFFTLPWILKPLLAPYLEKVATKKTLILATQLIISALTFLLALSLFAPDFFYLGILICFILALAAASYDITADGLYIVALNTQQQAYFIGIRTLCYQLARLFCQGGLLILVGLLIYNYPPLKVWQIVIILLSVLIFLLSIYHYRALPETQPQQLSIDTPHDNYWEIFNATLKDLKSLPNFVYIFIFTVIYNIPEAQLLKVVPLFMLDGTAKNGLGLDTTWVGTIYGGVSIISMLVGVTSAGFLINTFSLRKCILPVTLFAALSTVGYLLLALALTQNILVITFYVALAQLSFGLSNGVYMFWLLRTFSRSKYSMSLYTIGTTLMALGILVAGASSGQIQALLGYKGFFSWIIFLYISIFIFVSFKRDKILQG